MAEVLPEPGPQELEQNKSTEQIPEQKERTIMPGFEMVSCIIGLLGVFLYKKAKMHEPVR